MKSFFSNFIRKSIDTPYDPNRRFLSFFYKTIRIFYNSIKSFFHNELYLKSSLLTFYSLISIVPIFTIIFSIARVFGFEEFLQKQILETFKEQEDVISIAIQFSHAFLSHLKNQIVVGIGILILFFSVFGLFENIEKSLNSIWNVKKYRGFVRRSINYLMVLIFFPIIFIASISIIIFINSEIIQTTQNHEILKYFSVYVLRVLKFSSLGLICILFSYLYLFTPNTKIDPKTRIFSGIVAGIIFQFWQIIYIDFQFYITSYNVIYGSFAALPLFLIWMQVNFVIFLFGGVMAAQIEGDRFFKKAKPEDRFTIVNQKFLILLVLYEITSNYLKGKGPLSIEHISDHLGISLLDARDALNTLEKIGAIAEINPLKYLEQYQLIINPELFTIRSISILVDKFLLKETLAKDTSYVNIVSKCIVKFEELIKNSGNDLNLKDFVISGEKNEKI